MTGLPPLPDPRPAIIETDTVQVRGWACTSCGYALALQAPWCPRCRSEVAERQFGPGGTVWSSTVFRVPLPGREPPWVLAYVDLDDGPRVLAHVANTTARLHVGDRVRVAGSANGDIVVQAETRVAR